MTTTPATQAGSTCCSLEVVRGRDVGRIFELIGRETVLGNGIDGTGGLDLRDQEGGSPRRMAARQAAIEAKGSELVIRDLDSPGGTFVNRQRLLTGQARRLQPGDEIQLGGVVLRVGSPRGPAREVHMSASQPPSTGTGGLPMPYSIAGSVACRTWDDFLVVAAQRWNDLREELASGRLTDFLRRIPRNDLLPRPEGGSSLDEQLDQWLSRLPVSRSAAPELDVYPASLDVRGAGGGVTRHVLRITNVGYRLLRSQVRVEPVGTSWIRLGPDHDGRPFATVEETELPVEVTIPEGIRATLLAEIVVESNGGSRRIGVRVGPPVAPTPMPDGAAGTTGVPISELFRPVAQALAGVRVPARIAAGISGALAFRALVLASSLLPIGGQGTPTIEPRLPALAVLCAALGLLAGLLKGGQARGSGPADRVASGIAAGLFGIILAAIAYAVVRTIEGFLGAWASSYWALGMLWAALGAAGAALTVLIIPFRERSSEASA